MTALSADAEIRTLCGRTTKLVIPHEDEAPERLPVLAYAPITHGYWGGAGDSRAIAVQVTAIATTLAAANALLDRVTKAVTNPALAAAGADAAVRFSNRQDATWDVDEGGVRRAYGSLDLTLYVTN